MLGVVSGIWCSVTVIESLIRGSSPPARASRSSLSQPRETRVPRPTNRQCLYAPSSQDG